MEFKNLLSERNMTQTKVAKELNVTQSLVSQWVNGNCTPQPNELLKLVKLLGVSAEELLNCFKK